MVNPEQGPNAEEVLRTAEAARRLGVSTRELLRLIYEHKIRYVLVDGITYIRATALRDYQSKAS